MATVVIGDFYVACVNGDLATMKKMSEEMTSDDARASNNYALLVACESGHLIAVQWLTEHFGLTPEDARTYNCLILRSTCGKGHLEVVQWLIEHFGLMPEDVRIADINALRMACRYGHLNVAQWLVDKFGLTAEDAGEYAYMLDFFGAGGLGPKSAAKLT